PVTGEAFHTNFCDISGATAAADIYTLLNAPGQNRSYDGVELVFNKRMANRWMFRASGTIQDQKIHYANNSTTFPGSFQDPTNIPFTNDTWWAEQSTGSGSGGVFTGSRWSLKLSGAYQFAHDITVGGCYKAIDGNVVPIIRRKFQNYQEGAISVLLEPFDFQRLPTINYMDMKIDKGLAFGSAGKLNVSLDVFNVFNTNTLLRLERSANVAQLQGQFEFVAPRIFRFDC